MPTLEPGSISTDTTRTEDLLQCFIAAIPDDDRRAGYEMELSAIDFMDGDQQEDMDDLLERLFNALNEYVPEGHYFGAHPGNGSDYGVWANADLF